MNRDEHIAWCKQRALEYVQRGDLLQAVTSMLSDLLKHPETEKHKGSEIAVMFMLMDPTFVRDYRRVTEWIEGFR